MRKILLLLIALCPVFCAVAQSDFGTALPIAAGAEKTGTVSPSGRYVYYKTLLPADGTVTVYLEGIHMGGNNGSFSFYAYDKSGRQIAYDASVGSTTAKPGDIVRDTVRLTSRAVDSIYLLIYEGSSRTYNYKLKYAVLDQSTNDPEPNGLFSNATPMVHDRQYLGHLGYEADNVTDRYDYYKTLLPADGTIKVYAEGMHTGGNAGSFSLYVYDKSGRQIGYKSYVGSASATEGQTVRDSLSVYSRSVDSIYILLYQGSTRSYSYKVSYTVTDRSANDPEPNNTFAQAGTFNMGETMQGQLGQEANNVTDRYDYYKTSLQADGTLVVYLEGVHTGGQNGSFSFYAYDKSQRQIGYQASIGSTTAKPGDTVRDTIRITSLQADTVYLLVYQGATRSYSYKMSYEIADQSTNDPELNNTMAQAVPLKEQETVAGHLGYESDNVTDRYDYYKTVMPADGTITVYLEGVHTGRAAGSFSFYALDKSGRQIGYLANVGSTTAQYGQTVRDTVRITSRQADTVYLYVYQGSTRSYSYKMRYEMTDKSVNDAEPNNVRAEAKPISYNTTVQGHLGYEADNVTDRYDYYQAVMPADGTVTVYLEGVHTGGANGSFSLYALDKSGRQIGYLASAGSTTAKQGETVRDTVRITSREADTIYLYVYQGSTRSYSYKMRYEVLDQSPNDPEPNGEFNQALALDHNTTVSGHLGYEADNVTDRYDYYKTLLPADGTVTVYLEGVHTGGNNGSFSFYAYDKSRRQIAYLANAGSNTAKPGDIVRDTVLIPSRAADSIYLLVYQGSTRSYSYKLRYEMPTALTGDREPNNTFAEATRFTLKDTLKGLIGYVASAGSDVNDYYVAALPTKGAVQVIVKATNTSTFNAGFALYAYDKQRRQVGYRALPVTNAGGALRDTAVFNCLTTDSVYLLVYEGSSGHSFTYELQTSFQQQEPEALITYEKTGSLHEFSNASKFASKYSWDLGNGIKSDKKAPELISYNPGGYTIKMIAEHEQCKFKDTGYYELTVNGLDRFTPLTGGPGNTVFTVYGGGFHQGMQIQLKHGNIVLKDSVTFLNQQGSVFAGLVDMHNAPAGTYDVKITTRDTTYDIPGGFRLEAPVYKLRGEIVGRDVIRSNTDNAFTIRVYNDGNTMAGHTEVYLLTPDNMKVTRLDSLYVLPKTKYVNPDTLPEFRPVTTARGYPINGTMRSYLIAGIPAGGYKDLHFTVNAQVGKGNIHLWVKGPYSGSPYPSWADDCFKAKFKLAADLTLDGISVVPVADCVMGGVKAVVSTIYNAWNYFTGSSSGSSAASSLGKTVASAAKDCAGEIAAASGIATTVSPGIEIADIAVDAAVLGSNWEVNLNQIDIDCPDDPEDKKEKPVDTRTSLDPNAKSGPAGFGTGRFINGADKRMSYTIFFENMRTATLPAQEVTILDTLDKNVFDLSSFRAQSYGFGYKSFDIPLDAKDYVGDVSLNDQLAVRTYVKLNTTTGILKIVFRTIDKATGVTTEDPLAGFLPPNVQAPEGDGFVSFSINLKEGLSDRTVISNRASIVFDNNEPILTDKWVNTIDKNLPSSRVIVARSASDTTAMIKVQGSDMASGVDHYRLYASENGKPYQFAGKMKDSTLFLGKTDSSYAFYVVAVDAVGNRESKNSSSEASIKLNRKASAGTGSLRLYPVPSTGQVNLELLVEQDQLVTITVHSAAGQQMGVLYNGKASGLLKVNKQLAHLPNGLYFVTAKGSQGLKVTKKLVIAK
jgi:hypothetical protein